MAQREVVITGQGDQVREDFGHRGRLEPEVDSARAQAPAVVPTACISSPVEAIAPYFVRSCAYPATRCSEWPVPTRFRSTAGRPSHTWIIAAVRVRSMACG